MVKRKGKGKKESVGSASEQVRKQALTEFSQVEARVKIEQMSEGSVKAGNNSTGQEGIGEKNAEEEKSVAEKIAEEDAKEKRKAEEEILDIVETPPKRRSVDQKKADASMSSNEKSSSYNFRPKRAIPCFRSIDLSQSEFKGAVGKKVKVLPSGSKKWITGVIESYNARKKHHVVLYDDGLISELDMTKGRFELEVKPGEAYTLKGSSSGKGKNNKVDDDETKKKKASKAEKGKAIATETSEELSDDEPVEKTIKLGESLSARRAAKEVADAVTEAKTGPGKTKKKRGRKARKNVKTRK